MPLRLCARADAAVPKTLVSKAGETSRCTIPPGTAARVARSRVVHCAAATGWVEVTGHPNASAATQRPARRVHVLGTAIGDEIDTTMLVR